MYEKGTIKIVWIGEDLNTMESLMFEKTAQAVAYAKMKGLKDFMIMRLKSRNNDNYVWEVLPYGTWKPFKRYMKIYRAFSGYDGSEEIIAIEKMEKKDYFRLGAFIILIAFIFGLGLGIFKIKGLNS